MTFLCGSYADLNWYSKTVNIRPPFQHVPSATTYWRYVLFLVPEVRDVDPYIFIDMIGKYNAQERGGQIEPIRPLAGAASGPKTKPTVTGTVSAVGLTRRGFGSFRSRLIARVSIDFLLASQPITFPQER